MSGKKIDVHILIFGPPGSGKGTQAEGLKSRFGLIHLSTGDIFREAVKNKTELGKKAESIMKAGELVPDDVVSGVVAEKITEFDLFNTSFLFDGYPRNTAQAQHLDQLFKNKDLGDYLVIYLDVPDEEVVRRLSGRRVCRDCGKLYNVYNHSPQKADICDQCGGEVYQRADDSEETVKQRLKIYHDQTRPLIEMYKERSRLIWLNGTGTLEEVTRRVENALEKI